MKKFWNITTFMIFYVFPACAARLTILILTFITTIIQLFTFAPHLLQWEKLFTNAITFLYLHEIWINFFLSLFLNIVVIFFVFFVLLCVVCFWCACLFTQWFKNALLSCCSLLHRSQKYFSEFITWWLYAKRWLSSMLCAVWYKVICHN